MRRATLSILTAIVDIESCDLQVVSQLYRKAKQHNLLIPVREKQGMSWKRCDLTHGMYSWRPCMR